MVRCCAPVAVLLVWLVPTGRAVTVQDVVNQVSSQQYRHFLDDVLYTHLGSNKALSGAQHNLARDAILNHFASLNWQASLDPHPAAWYGPACVNVVAIKPGQVRPLDIYIVGAHYDSVNNPGGDDNASGVAVIMEAARILAQYNFEATITLIAFDAEEFQPGYAERVGSRGYAATHQSDHILGMVALDMISFNDGANKAYIGSDRSPTIQSRLASAVTLYGQGLTPVLTGQVVDTDNWSFVNNGVENCYLTEEWPNPNYHLLSDSVDTPNYIDYAYATKMTRSVVGYVATEAGLIGLTPDTVPPVAVGNLAATPAATVGSVDLTWTAPADYGAQGTGPFPSASYDLRYSTSTITAANWGAATQATGEPAPKAPGQAESFTVSGLTGGTTYYFALKSKDTGNNISALSNVPSATATGADTTAPNWVGNLLGKPSKTAGEVDLAWTAPADYRYNHTGPYTAASYDLRYSTSLIRWDDADATWNAAIQVTGLTVPKAPGSAETFTVSGLTGGTIYHFAIKSKDASNNVSEVSNSAPVRAPILGEKTLQIGLDGYTGQMDSYLMGNNDTTQGTQDRMVVAGFADQGVSQIRRGILRFDLAGIPTGVTITSATLSLYSYDATQVKGDSGFYGAYPVNRSWTDTAVTWTHAAAGIAWTASGGDFAVAPDATSPKQAAASVWYPFDVAARVRAWLGNPSTNYGWIIKCTDETLHNQDRFYQSETTNAAYRPKLVLSDLPAPTAGDLNGDGKVNVLDVLILGDSWGLSLGVRGYDPRCDPSGDGAIGEADLEIVAAGWPN